MGYRVVFLLAVLLLAHVNTGAQNFPIAPFDNSVSDGGQKTSIKNNHKSLSTIEDFYNGIFLRTVVDKVNLFEDELVQVRWVLFYPNIPKLNVEYQITNYQIPNLPDFVKERNIIASEADSSVVRGVLENGLPYRARTLLCFYMYPSKSGKAVVESGALSLQIYGADGNEYGKPLLLKSKAVTLNVNPLPKAPENFSGGIGEYTLTTELLSEDTVRVGSTITYRVRLKGSGNFKLAKFSFPDSVECYSVKPVNNIHYDCNRCSGERVFDYLFIPKKEGCFTIPSASFTYFDSRCKRYKTLSTDACRISVLSPLPKKEGVVPEVPLQPKEKDTFSLWLYVCGGLLGVCILLSVLAYLHKRSKKESRVDYELKAYDALNEAKQTLEGAPFYNKTVSVLINYIGDKLNYPVPTQSKKVLVEILRENGASEAAVSLVLSVINESEKACYSPDTDIKQDTIFETAVFAITQLQKDFDGTIRCNTIS